ncbi:TonB-dependent receptor plug domain-containing protein [Edwardsiella anguillarum]|nr:TonB-dependent receptor plug domain-containing protein [Edwardsiella anguillarum]
MIEQQQAVSVADVLQNDPTVRVAKGFGNFQELYMIRGFPVYSDDMTLNGVYGIYRVSLSPPKCWSGLKCCAVPIPS